MSTRRARGELRHQFQLLVNRTPDRNCFENPIPYTEVRQTPRAAAAMCEGCPILEACGAYGRMIRADGLVHGGKYWVAGKPLAA